MSQKKNRQFSPVLCNNFKIENFDFTKLDKNNEMNKLQMIAFPQYKYPDKGINNFVFKTGPIQMIQYGLPALNTYRINDSMRNFINVPFDPYQDKCIELEQMLTKIDDYAIKNKFKILNEYEDLFNYQPIIRGSTYTNNLNITKDKDQNNKKKKEKLKYCKMKLNLSYPDKIIKTKVFIKKNIMDKTPKSIEISNATQLEEYLTLGSTVNFIVMANKLWATKDKINMGIRMYGVTLKILRMDIFPKMKKVSINKAFKSYSFINSKIPEGNETKYIKEYKNFNNDLHIPIIKIFI